MLKSQQSKILLSFLCTGMNLLSIRLSEIKEISRLSNYEEIKNIETSRIIDYDNYDRKGNYVYVHGESEPFTGIVISKDLRGNIVAIIPYNNGNSNGIKYEYYSNGQLSFKNMNVNNKMNGEAEHYYLDGKLQSHRYYENDIIKNDTEYQKNGIMFRTFKMTEGLNGISTVYYENGKDIKSIAEVTQDYSQKGRINNILNGKLKVYSKQGQLQGIFNFKNNSMAGLSQEIYYPNGKIKYYAIAKDNNQKNPTFTQKAISYYDNGQEKENCDEVDSGMWMCKKYDKNGKFKGEVQKGGQPIETSNFWANFFMGVLNILFQ
ncbi:hypothetical protein [Leptotrichia shahii]|uniref:hypothetical protein n=1 Tax=Leptotrichia shahii TaxID=157691 RepID=UPI0028CFF905|nr:hypothetical protein [Leptotrichia shahii]